MTLFCHIIKKEKVFYVKLKTNKDNPSNWQSAETSVCKHVKADGMYYSRFCRYISVCILRSNDVCRTKMQQEKKKRSQDLMGVHLI